MSSRKVMELSKKSSPLVAAGMGAVVCLSGGTAGAVSGNVSASNMGQQTFNSSNVFNVFGGLGQGNIITNLGAGYMAAVNVSFCRTGAYLNQVAAGISVAGMSFGAYPKVGHNTSNNYIGIKTISGPKYGWIHVISTNANGTQIKMDTWSYNNTNNGAIKTLDESVMPKRLALSDGRLKLNWSNANESGVARYEVQAKGGNGAWAAVDSSVPGEGSYASTVKAGEYRLVVENSDGTSRSINF